MIFKKRWILFLFLCVSITVHGALHKASILRVIDGDTLLVNFDGQVEKLRLIGIDAPETAQSKQLKWQVHRWGLQEKKCLELGARAKRALKQLCEGHSHVYLEFDTLKRDVYGRLLAYVYLSHGEMLNQSLLSGGYAHVFIIPPNLKYQELFASVWLDRGLKK